jgi:hypothetical protein
MVEALENTNQILAINLYDKFAQIVQAPLLWRQALEALMAFCDQRFQSIDINSDGFVMPGAQLVMYIRSWRRTDRVPSSSGSSPPANGTSS